MIKHFRTDATPQRQTTSPALQPPLDPRCSISVEEHVVAIKEDELTISLFHVCNSH